MLVKTLERLIYNRIFGFIENNLLRSHQYGFRPGYYCTSQLIHLFYEWAKALDKRLSTDVIFLDFEKFFDSVPHDRLLLKLEHFGITGSLLSCLSNFLPGRSHVVIEGFQSANLTGCLSYLVFHRGAFLWCVTVQSPTQVQILSILPLLPSQISRSTLGWSVPSSYQPHPSGEALDHLPCHVTSNFEHSSSFL